MELSTWVEIGALAVSTGTILGGVSAFFSNFKKEQNEKYLRLEERMFQLATGKTLAQAIKEDRDKKEWKVN